MRWLQHVPWRSLGRWWIVGLAFTAIGIGILYAFTGVLRMPLMVGTLLSAEVTLLVRFLINDRWVFRHPRPTWTRLWQFHVASAAGATVWWLVSNILPRFGVHYLVAAVAGSGCAVFFGMTTNFLWIWRERGGKPSNVQPEDREGATATERNS